MGLQFKGLGVSLDEMVCVCICVCWLILAVSLPRTPLYPCLVPDPDRVCDVFNTVYQISH